MSGLRLTADWLSDPAAREVAGLIERGGYRALFVGGCVRNALLGLPAADIDVATDARPETVVELAGAAGVKAVPTGIAHGTVTLVVGGRPVEVTTFRRDLTTDGRRATIAFTEDVREDAARRDFTMNALYARLDGSVLDPLGGLPDLRARRVRFVGDPGARIAEDHLRILRFFRFHAWYGAASGGLDAEGLAACEMGQAGLDRLSRERVGAEMTKLLGAPDPEPAVAAMAAIGVLGRILPGAEARALGSLIAAEGDLPPSWHRRLAALGGEAGWAERLKLSRADARRFAATREALASDLRPAASAFRFGAEPARDAAVLRAAASGQALPGDLAAEIARGAGAAFPLRAAEFDLEGAALGAELRRLEALWLASDLRMTAGDLRRAGAARP